MLPIQKEGFLGAAGTFEELEVPEADDHRRDRLRPVAILGIIAVCCVAVAVVAGTPPGRRRSLQPSDAATKSPFQEARVDAETILVTSAANSVAASPAAAAPVYEATQSCYGYTGGTCGLSDCDPEREATCRSEKCICEGSCAGADGKCHLGATNAVVVADFTLTNVHWPRYSMYFKGLSVFGQLATTSAYSLLNLERDKFALYRLAGSETRFLLGSVAYPDHVTRIAATGGTGADETYGLYASTLGGGTWSPEELALSVCYLVSMKAIMIGDHQQSHWAYLQSSSWKVFASSREQTEAVRRGVWTPGLWSPSPEFTVEQAASLPSC